jgi:hypothetical protein
LCFRMSMRHLELVALCFLHKVATSIAVLHKVATSIAVVCQPWRWWM